MRELQYSTIQSQLYINLIFFFCRYIQCLWLKNLFSYLSFVDIKLYSNSNVNDMCMAW